MRIIAGKLKGITLYRSENKITRPLKDQVRESIFNLLTHSNNMFFQFENSNILDLYAGTGSFGLECLSRGSDRICFVEREKTAIQILKKNIEKLKLNKNVDIFFDDIFHLMKKKNIFKEKFNLIFCDPPFKNINTEKLLELIFYEKLLKKNGIIILHRNKITREKFPSYFKVLDERIYGISKIIFGKFLS